MIDQSIVTHSCTVTRQGTTTSAAGDTVSDGTYAATAIVDEPCIAEPVSGEAPADQRRTPSRSTWVVLLKPGADVRIRDRIAITDAVGTTTCMVMDARHYSYPVQVAHTRLTCQEVAG